MRKLLWPLLISLCLMASPVFGGAITDKSIGGLIDVLEHGALTEMMVGGGDTGNEPVWTTCTGTGAPVRAGSPTLTGTAVVAGIDGSGTISGNLFTPDAADGADIGTTALEISDIYLADGSIIYFGNDQDVTLTHVADTGLALNLGLTAPDITLGTGAAGGDLNILDQTTWAYAMVVHGDSGTAALGADRTVTINVVDGDRTIDLGADLVVAADSVINQDLSTNGNPYFLNVRAATYGSDASVSNAELLVIDDGATTEIPVGGGAGNALVWTTATGTGAPMREGSPTTTGTMIAAGIDASGTISANLFTPDAADGADIGSAALEFSDIYLADGSIIKWQNDQSVTLTSSATGLTCNLNLAATTYGSNGTVLDAELLYINSLSSNAQTQITTNAGLVDTDDKIIAIINASPGTQIDVAAGGIGVGTLALNGVLFGNGTSAIGATAIGAAGDILVAGADPFVPAWTAGTGTGVPVRANTPTLITPELGAATGTSLVLSGSVFSAVDLISDDNSLSAAQCYGSANILTGAETTTLPAAVAGMSIFIYSTDATVKTIDTNGNDHIWLNGVDLGAAADINSPAAVGDFIVLAAFSNNNWYSLGQSGTWVITP